MTRITWLTDLHLNFLSGDAVDRYLARVAATHADAVLISGDIAESQNVTEYLEWIAGRLASPVYFVLGNHDFYNGSIAGVRQAVTELCERDPRLIWLSAADAVPLTQNVGLVGHDGWADAQLGDYERSLVMMNDYRLIAEFARMSKEDRWPLLIAEAEAAAAHIRRVLPPALERFPHVVLVTHVPPFRDACWHQGAISDDEWLPHFTSKAMGDALLAIMRDHPTRRLTVLCGHTHGRGEARPAENMLVLTGGAEYGSPGDRTRLRIRVKPAFVMTIDRDDWRPTANWQALRRRAAMLAQLRAFFERHGFLEVETPLVSADTVVDRHLDPFSVVLPGMGQGAERRLWLQTSPEFAMKRLLAAGGEAIYQVTRAFRQDELGQWHNPEFTIVEWYRRGDGMHAGMQFLSALCQELLGTAPAAPLTYQAAFEKYVGLDPHNASDEEMRAAAQRHGIAAPDSLATADRDAWLDLLLVSIVEPRLGQDVPVILHDYPPSQAALAIVRSGPPPVAERFELYVRGVELANGYHELLDPAVLRARNHANNVARAGDGKEKLPEESRLISAMEAGLPAATGVALGFDRIVMLAVGAANIAEVIAFPFDRA